MERTTGGCDTGSHQANLATHGNGDLGSAHLEIGGRENNLAGTSIGPDTQLFIRNIVTGFRSKTTRTILVIACTNAIEDDFRHCANLGRNGHFFALVEAVVGSVGHTLLHVNGNTVFHNRELTCS